MNKKVLILTFIFLVAGVALLIKFSSKEPIKQKVVTQVTPTDIVPTEKLPSNTLKEYSDPSGFKFSYPEDTEIEIIDNSDNSVYSDLILTSPVATGSISLKVSDTKYKSIEAWKKDNKELTSGLEIQDAKLGDLAGISFGSKKKLTQIVFDQGIEFNIDVDLQTEKNYWENVYYSLINSFSFVSNTTSTSNASVDTSSGSDVIFEGEEVIE